MVFPFLPLLLLLHNKHWWLHTQETIFHYIIAYSQIYHNLEFLRELLQKTKLSIKNKKAFSLIIIKIYSNMCVDSTDQVSSSKFRSVLPRTKRETHTVYVYCILHPRSGHSESKVQFSWPAITTTVPSFCSVYSWESKWWVVCVCVCVCRVRC